MDLNCSSLTYSFFWLDDIVIIVKHICLYGSMTIDESVVLKCVLQEGVG